MSQRIAIITGASSGIGKATAIALAEKGFAVGLGYNTNFEGARRVAVEVQSRGGIGMPFRVDLADPLAAADGVERAAIELGGVDVLVNNAGVNRRAAILDETLGDWQRIFTVNATGPFLCAQVAARRMVAQGRGGRIVNVTSVHEMIPIRGGSAYCASKGALGMLTKVMALELAAHGITVNAVSPGETATPMNGVPEDRDAATIERPGIPVGRPGRSREVAALIAHLAEPDAAYITGVSITVDGGLSLMSAIPNQEYAGRL
ncbi:SDR family oxidoreductase [Polyangium aurulentum]|uniref:SDR family oxidoreductase n=1 Tax=Polyangium aurulentum TaxID=2567896 RepID=UPI0010ADE86D|nr:SDR family oxidoreductase [Polyangium aurulentum]UQA56801.1 SDR family oxidoreductase [Polyangium aurulentum]